MLQVLFLLSAIQTKIIELTDENYLQTLTEKDPMLVLYHVEKCQPCQDLLQELQIVANNTSISIGTLDCLKNKNITKKLELQWYPVVVYYNNKAMDIYKGDRKSENILSWINKKISGSIKPFEETEKDYILIQTNGVIDEKIQKLSQKLEIPFFKRSGPDSIIIQRNGQKIEQNSLQQGYQFIVENAFQGEFDSDISQLVFDEFIPTMLFFYDESDELFEQVENVERMIKFKIQKNSEWGKRLITYLDIKEFPKVVILKTMADELKKYFFDKEITTQNLQDFVDIYLAGGLEKKLKSQEQITDQNSNVYQMVGKEFESMVFDRNFTVVVMIYDKNTPEETHNTYEEVSKKFDFIFTKIDKDLNDIPEGINFEKLPYIFLHAKRNNAFAEINQPIDKLEESLSKVDQKLKNAEKDQKQSKTEL